MVFVDTNVIVYANDASTPEKQARAAHWLAYLWRTRQGRVSFQVLQEFYVIVTGKLGHVMSPDEARAEVRELAAWAPVLVDERLLARAWTVQDRFGFSWWDAAIVAAAQVAQCRYLLTEDLQTGQDLGGVLVVNPFETEPDSLT